MSCTVAKRSDHRAKLIHDYPAVILKSRGNAFETLLRAIVGQQISVNAADAVWSKIHAATPIKPEVISIVPRETLRGCDLSRMKTEYVIDLAAHFADGRIRPHRWVRMDDEAIIAELTHVRGIGRWTAEVFLIFHLLRNIWPVDDLGLLKAISLHYLNGRKVMPRTAKELDERWQPWRTVTHIYGGAWIPTPWNIKLPDNLPAISVAHPSGTSRS